MSDRPVKRLEGGPWPDESEVSRLLQMAGHRPAVPASDLARIKAAVREEWRQRWQRSRSPARIGAITVLAAAAAVVVAVGVFLWQSGRQPVAPPVVVVAATERVIGTVTLSRGSLTQALTLSSPVHLGDVLETGAGGEIADSALAGSVSIRLTSGASLRLRRGTRARILGDTLVELERGTLYADLLPSAEGSPQLSIRTPVGVVRDMGTQFEVRVGGDPEEGLRVRVREGLVSVEVEEAAHLARAGEELLVHSDGAVAKRPLPAYGPHWDWVLETAPTLDIEGKSLQVFLEWVSRETGWGVELPADLDPAVDCGVLHGGIAHLRPDEALSVVLPSCELGHQVLNGTLIIRPSDSSDTQP